MGRLAAIVATDAAAAAAQLNGLIEAIPATEGDHNARLEAGRAAFGVWSFDAPQLASTPRTIAALDGAVFNSKELGGGESDALLVATLVERHGFVETVRRLNGDFALA